jgi:putative two-component system response regulator
MRPRILIVDDSDINLKVLVRLLKDSYELSQAKSGEECLARLREFEPDLVLLDIMMPGMDGYETCQRIKSSPLGKFTQVVLVSAKGTAAERMQGYEVGADDYVVKPFDHEELLAKVRVQFRLRKTVEDLWQANAKIHQFNVQLERIIEERTAEIVATRDITVLALAKLAESRDPETGEHLERMRTYSRILAEELRQHGPYCAQISETFVDDIFRSSPLHDIGKVGIRDSILLKPDALSAEEFEIMKQHTVIGEQALRHAAKNSDFGGFLAMATEIARHHHERFDGRGYPDGLAGHQIPLSARIVGLADVYDALTSARVYKPAYGPAKARQIIESEDGRHFDPAVVAAFRETHGQFLEFLHTAQRREEESPAAELADASRC